MMKTVFQNSKAALIFAVLTIFAAVSMVGSKDDSGVLLKAVSAAEAQKNRYAAQTSGGSAPPPPAVFGEYTPPSQTSNVPAASPVTQSEMSSSNVIAPRPGEPFNPATAPRSPTAIVAGDDSVPLPSGSAGSEPQ